jgi:uncharacterized iron-regulated membrane protein
VLPLNALHETATDNYYADRYSAIIMGSQKFSERNPGQRMRATFRPVHTSSIFGLPSKIIGFIACLLGASFPVTGTIMWLNRMRKKRKLLQRNFPGVLIPNKYSGIDKAVREV